MLIVTGFHIGYKGMPGIRLHNVINKKKLVRYLSNNTSSLLNIQHCHSVSLNGDVQQLKFTTCISFTLITLEGKSG